MDLCTLTAVKEVLGIKGGQVEYDSRLQAILSAVSSDMEKYLCRGVEFKERTQLFDVLGTRFFQLKAFGCEAHPIIVTSVRNDPQWEFDSASEVADDYYRISNETGVLRFLRGVLTEGDYALEAKYRGGMGLDAGDIERSDEFKGLAEACAVQTAFQFRADKAIGATAVSTQGGSVSVVGDVGFLTSVKKTLNLHKLRSI